MKKKKFWAQFWHIWLKFEPPIFFFTKIWLHQSLDIMVSYHHVQYQKKLMIQSWESLVADRWLDGQMDWEMDRQTDKSDFIGCCPTNVEHPKHKHIGTFKLFLNKRIKSMYKLCAQLQQSMQFVKAWRIVEKISSQLSCLL